MSHDEAYLQRVKQSLGEVSPSFCLAKWTQVSIHLHNGSTHSCHHPPPHKISEKLLADNPSALHNTPEKMDERAQMLRGQRPKGCDYCWRIEDVSEGHNTSDRIYKSGSEWSLPFKDEVLESDLGARYTPKYVEVNLGSICNFKCSYCSPEVSTRWMSEYKEHGLYPTLSSLPYVDRTKLPIPADEPNPYLDAFWKWWPELYPKLNNFRVTGGEPLLNKDLYKVMDWIKANPNPNLTFGVNTNLCPPEDKWQVFLSDLKLIAEKKMVKRLEIFTSAEAWGEKAEYIRFGMNFELWRKRLWELLEAVPKAEVTIMATYNALSVSSFDLLLEEAVRIKSNEKFYNSERLVPLFLDISFLRNPAFQAVKSLTPEFLSLMDQQVRYMREHDEKFIPSENRYQRGFLSFETQKMERIRNWFADDTDELDNPHKKMMSRVDFFRFFTEHDRRRKTDFLKTFPEFTQMWRQFEKINDGF